MDRKYRSGYKDKTYRIVEKKLLDNFEFLNSNELRETVRAIKAFELHIRQGDSFEDALIKVGTSYSESYIQNVKEYYKLK